MSWDCKRHMHLVARGWNEHGEPTEVEGTEILARCIQHETDHLDGVLFVDRLDTQTRKAALKAIREAEWFDGQVPVVKQSPHPLTGSSPFGRAH
jgi:peptide deformylase